MWNDKRSLMLSKLCCLLFGLALAAALAGGPWLVDWLDSVSINVTSENRPWFLATLYTGGAVAAALLWWLYRLLHNISAGLVFVPGNAALLRAISWACFAGAAICLLSALYYLPWGLVGLAAAFVGLIVRVVKNVIAQAITLKEENDYTI